MAKINTWKNREILLLRPALHSSSLLLTPPHSSSLLLTPPHSSSLLFTPFSPVNPYLPPEGGPHPCWRSPPSSRPQWLITIQCVIDWTGSHCGSHTCDADTAGKGAGLPLIRHPPSPSPTPFRARRGAAALPTKAPPEPPSLFCGSPPPLTPSLPSPKATLAPSWASRPASGVSDSSNCWIRSQRKSSGWENSPQWRAALSVTPWNRAK